MNKKQRRSESRQKRLDYIRLEQNRGLRIILYAEGLRGLRWWALRTYLVGCIFVGLGALDYAAVEILCDCVCVYYVCIYRQPITWALARYPLSFFNRFSLLIYCVNFEFMVYRFIYIF